MESTKFLNAIQLITGIAVLIGLALVIWELQQAREIAKADRVSASMSEYAQRVQSMMGENSAAALAKACDFPDNLTTEEMIVLDHFYTEVINNLRDTYMIQTVSPDLAVFDWKQWIGNFGTIFATEYGRWWWEQGGWEHEIREAGKAYLDEVETVPCKTRYESYRNRNADG